METYSFHWATIDLNINTTYLNSMNSPFLFLGCLVAQGPMGVVVRKLQPILAPSRMLLLSFTRKLKYQPQSVNRLCFRLFYFSE